MWIIKRLEYLPSMFIKSMNTFFTVSVPELHSFIITCGHNQPSIWRESNQFIINIFWFITHEKFCLGKIKLKWKQPGTAHPIHVSIQWELKFLAMNRPYLKKWWIWNHAMWNNLKYIQKKGASKWKKSTNIEIHTTKQGFMMEKKHKHWNNSGKYKISEIKKDSSWVDQ